MNDHKLSEQYLKHVGREAQRKAKAATEKRTKDEAAELRKKYDRELVLSGGGMGGGAFEARSVRQQTRGVRQAGFGA